MVERCDWLVLKAWPITEPDSVEVSEEPTIYTGLNIGQLGE